MATVYNGNIFTGISIMNRKTKPQAINEFETFEDFFTYLNESSLFNLKIPGDSGSYSVEKAKAASANIKKILTVLFPEVKFSVKKRQTAVDIHFDKFNPDKLTQPIHKSAKEYSEHLCLISNWVAQCFSFTYQDPNSPPDDTSSWIRSGHFLYDFQMKYGRSQFAFSHLNSQTVSPSQLLKLNENFIHAHLQEHVKSAPHSKPGPGAAISIPATRVIPIPSLDPAQPHSGEGTIMPDTRIIKPKPFNHRF